MENAGQMRQKKNMQYGMQHAKIFYVKSKRKA